MNHKQSWAAVKWPNTVTEQRKLWCTVCQDYLPDSMSTPALSSSIGRKEEAQYWKPIVLRVEEGQQISHAETRCLQRLTDSLPLAFCPRIRMKTYSCFILQQKRVTYSPNIHICPNTPAPYQVSFVETVFGKVGQTNPLACRTAQSVWGLKTLRCAPPSPHSSGLLGSSFRF